MSYMIYCIFRSPLLNNPEVPAGIGGQRVFTINYKDLGAACSNLEHFAFPPAAHEFFEHARVIESFYRHLTVIPLRYGCRVECPTEIAGLLKKNNEAYGAILRELYGLAEMGIQVPLGKPRVNPNGAWRSAPAKSLPLTSSALGPAYLETTKQPDLSADYQGTALQNAFVEEVCDSLYGFFVGHKVEFPSAFKSRLLSLYFLVPRDAVEPFRQAARHIHINNSPKLVLGGPWPPYNFVNPYEWQVPFGKRILAGPALN